MFCVLSLGDTGAQINTEVPQAPLGTTSISVAHQERGRVRPVDPAATTTNGGRCESRVDEPEDAVSASPIPGGGFSR